MRQTRPSFLCDLGSTVQLSYRVLVKPIAAILALAALKAQMPPVEYSIYAIRYANSPGDLVKSMVMGAPNEERLDTIYALWLIRGGGRNILFDSGFHRERWFKQWKIEDYVRPDKAVALAGVDAEDITDIIISHAHWDHMGGIDLFPKATVWIQKDEFQYYSGVAWQPGGRHGGIDPEDVQELIRLNTAGRVRFVNGDDVEILPGIRAYTGARHTFASQYICVAGNPPFVLASDNVDLYRNIAERRSSATFSKDDQALNVAEQLRMIQLAGSRERVIPGHDALQFHKFPTTGRIATIKSATN